ncbi:hypothetical protein ISF_06118 [Cordyceps fumosorosea ARSEF 2679]|uniref:Uncharacterized protein n=1 Tax=Cordyceps fumosorosea (strain ARSEF 2679) TaxID=1081104 RepID=A0A167T014_CORFA|nr:hypothetical protein ISF_06118 [Cordyceps fumosorosea ARSEF 2679]OAA60107.1 hypothetical protein ISF_06118 [Cordyceps fumosorosea ARSEF 2679]
MPPRSPDNPFQDLFLSTTSPSTPPPAPAPSTTTTASDHLDDQSLPPGTMVRYLWTCHLCGYGSFRCDSSSTALCVQCAHAVCDGCTAFFGARLLECVDAENLPGHAAPPNNPLPSIAQTSLPNLETSMSRCRSHNPVRRCRAASGLRRLRHEPYARPTHVQHCVVTFRPGRDGRPALGTFFYTRPRFERPSLPFSTPSSPLSRPDQTRDCIARSVARASGPATIVIPPIHEIRPRDDGTAPAGVPVCTVPLARFFAAGAPSVARALGLGRQPVICVRVDPVLAFVAYYLCASFYAALAVWEGGRGAATRQPSRAAPE